ncbi:MAG: Acetyl-coenzyme A carboxylase carboxyl transferase subunit alpha [bacterium ADurb.Bin429]|nr:MAG: Acetyl-coenzyme A carboxylase carboxyl transferase subunit alpha [bacterium ADurb.Bin429]
MISTSRWLPFEKPLQDIDEQIRRLEEYTTTHGIDRSDKIRELREEHDALCVQIFSNLSAWDKTLLARHPNRPYTLDYIRMIFDDFVELHGDRRFGDDPAMVAGIATLQGRTVVVIGQQKGRDVKERTYRNFGSARPDGYRKAERLMDIAERHGVPLVSFIDTPAAEGRLEAEERGISEAIASSMAHLSRLRTPVFAIVTGEGGSGGAIAIGVADHVAMLEHAIYSIMPPEGCAAILDTFGRDGSRGYQAAEALKLTAQMNLELGLIDEVVPEPFGGAHRDPLETANRIKACLLQRLSELQAIPTDALLERRYAKFRAMGQFTTE